MGITARSLTLADPVTAEGRRLLEVLTPFLPVINESAPEHDETGTFPAGIFALLSEAGALRATVPVEFGGLGVTGLHDTCLALLRTAEADASTALALHMQLSRGLTMTREWRYGSREGRSVAERILRLMGTGGAIVCGAVAEPGRTHDCPATELVANGTGQWSLTGRKSFVTMAPVATHFAVSTVIRGSDEGALVVVPRETAGITVHDNWDGLGMRASGSVDVTFDSCPVAPEDVIPRDRAVSTSGAALIGQTISSICMLGIYVGIALAAYDITVETITRRNSQLASAGRTLLAEIEARLYAMRATVAAAVTQAETLAERADFGRDIDLSDVGRQMMMAFQCAKLTTNHSSCAVVDDCLSLVGGSAYAAGHPLARLWRDVRAGGFMHPYSYVDAVDFLSRQITTDLSHAAASEGRGASYAHRADPA